jgi:hypothetical protein
MGRAALLTREDGSREGKGRGGKGRKERKKKGGRAGGCSGAAMRTTILVKFSGGRRRLWILQEPSRWTILRTVQ